MKSRASFSESSLLRGCLRRYWPVCFAALIVLLLSLPFPLANRLSDLAPRATYYENASPEQLRAFIAQDTVASSVRWLPIFTGFFALAAAMAAFEHTYSARLTGLYASLPVRRGQIFRQHWLAGLWMILSAGIVTALAVLAVEAVHGAVDMRTVLSWLGFFALETIAFYGIAVFCVMLTGHVLVIPALYLLVNFAAVALSFVLAALTESYVYGVMNGMELFTGLNVFSPLAQLSTKVYAVYQDGGVFDGFRGWGWAIAYCAVGLLLSLCALLLFKARHNERAQETTAFPVLRPLLKYIVAAFFALCFPMVVLFFFGVNPLHSGSVGAARFAAHLLFTVIGAVIGYFLSEMIIRKSLRVSSGSGWAKALLVGLIACAVVCMFRFDLFGAAKRIPAAADVQQIELRAQDHEYTLESPEGIEAVQALQREIIARRGESEALLAAGKNYTNLNLTYALQNGKVVQRSYAIPEGALVELAEEALNSPAVRSGLKEVNPPVPVDRAHMGELCITYLADGSDYYSSYYLYGEEAVAFYEAAIRPDVLAGHYGMADLALGWDEAEYGRTHYDISIWISLNGDDENSCGASLYYVPTIETENTNAWLTEHGIPLRLVGERAG